MLSVDASKSPTRRQAAAVLLMICAAGLGLRIYHAFVAVAVSPDSALFIEYARRLAEDPGAALPHYQQHPFYPTLILLFHPLANWLAGSGPAGWILAGRLAAIASSLGAIAALYWLTARLYDRSRALVAAALLAVLPDACRYGADVLSDLPHLALYLTGLAALLTGMQTERARHLLLAAAASALAFLTRPEGGSVLLVGIVVLAVHRDWGMKKRAGLAVAMVAVFFCLAAPYQFATGKLIQKKSPLDLFKLGSATPAGHVEVAVDLPGDAHDPVARGFSRGERESAEHSGPPPLKRRATEKKWTTQTQSATTLPVPVNVLRQWVRAGRVVYVLLAIVGVAVCRPRGIGGRILGAALSLHFLLLNALELRYGYLDRRHALILATLSLPLAAEGIWWLAGRLGGRARTSPSAVQFGAVIGIVVFCVVVTSPWLLRPINTGEKHVVASARWVAHHTSPGTLIVSDSRLRRVALYADRPFAEWPWWRGSVKHLAKFLRDKGEAACFVVDVKHMTAPRRNPAFFEELVQKLGEQLELMHAESGPPTNDPTEIRIYRYRRTPPSGTSP